MQRFKIGTLTIGSGDMTAVTPSSDFTCGSSNPSNANGADGDVYVKDSGSLSDIFIKADGRWESILGRPISVALNASMTGAIAFSFPAAYFAKATIEWSIIRGSVLAQGTFKILNNGIPGMSGATLIDFNNNNLGGSTGVTFDAQVDGLGNNVDVLYDSTAGAAITFNYSIKGWS